MNDARWVYQNLPVSEVGYIAGVAIFDLKGLPVDHFTANHPLGGSWIQVMFQSLGLQSLLSSFFQLQGFQQVSLRSGEHYIVLSRKGDYYVGLIACQAPDSLKEALLHLSVIH